MKRAHPKIRAKKEPVVDPEVARQEQDLLDRKEELQRILVDERTRLEDLRWGRWRGGDM